MKDFFGNELKVGQEVMYINRYGFQGKNFEYRKGKVVDFITHTFPNYINEEVIILSVDSGKRIKRHPNAIIGNIVTTSRETFLEGENHL